MKIKKIVFKLSESGMYNIIALNDYPIGILSEFLRRFNGSNSFIQAIKDPLLRCSDYPGITLRGYGEILFDKVGDNLRLIVSWDSDFENEPDKSPLIIPVDQFVYITEEWIKLEKLRKPYILITEENNKYSIAAFDENPVSEPMSWRNTQQENENNCLEESDMSDELKNYSTDYIKRIQKRSLPDGAYMTDVIYKGRTWKDKAMFPNCLSTNQYIELAFDLSKKIDFKNPPIDPISKKIRRQFLLPLGLLVELHVKYDTYTIDKLYPIETIPC